MLHVCSHHVMLSMGKKSKHGPPPHVKTTHPTSNLILRLSHSHIPIPVFASHPNQDGHKHSIADFVTQHHVCHFLSGGGGRLEHLGQPETIEEEEYRWCGDQLEELLHHDDDEDDILLEVGMA
ncbi:hypothetical protein ACLOJK_007800 [Asimina triloba]